MAALFTAASTQYLTNSTPPLVSTGYPFSFGMWVNLTAVGAAARTLFSFSDTGTTNNYLSVRMTAAETVSIVGAAGGTENVATSVQTLAAGQWSFLLGQFISSTNRRLWASLGGVSFNGQATTARAPTGLDTITIGALQTSGGVTEPWDGLIGEYWLSNATFMDLGTSEFTAAIAQNGPFAYPHFVSSILEYRSFRKGVISDTDEIDEVFHGAAGRQTWTNTNGVTISHHPPLPYWYAKPGQVIRNLTI